MAAGRSSETFVVLDRIQRCTPSRRRVATTECPSATGEPILSRERVTTQEKSIRWLQGRHGRVRTTPTWCCALCWRRWCCWSPTLGKHVQLGKPRKLNAHLKISSLAFGATVSEPTAPRSAASLRPARPSRNRSSPTGMLFVASEGRHPHRGTPLTPLLTGRRRRTSARARRVPPPWPPWRAGPGQPSGRRSHTPHSGGWLGAWP